MTYLSVGQVIDLHRRIVDDTGGSHGLRDPGALASAVSQPAVTFAGMELYPDEVEKAAALAYSLVMNHPFIDGNKRIGHAAMEAFLELNGYGLSHDESEHERVMLAVASGQLEREYFGEWVRSIVYDLDPEGELK